MRLAADSVGFAAACDSVSFNGFSAVFGFDLSVASTAFIAGFAFGFCIPLITGFGKLTSIIACVDHTTTHLRQKRHLSESM